MSERRRAHGSALLGLDGGALYDQRAAIRQAARELGHVLTRPKPNPTGRWDCSCGLYGTKGSDDYGREHLARAVRVG